MAADPVVRHRRGRRDGRQPRHRQAAVAAASLTRPPVANARSQALATVDQRAARRCSGRPTGGQARMGGVGQRRGGERTGLPRHVSRRRVFASRRQHPADPRRGAAVGADAARTIVRGIAIGYEVQIDLVTAICLHEHKNDHVAHLCPSRRRRHRHDARARRRRPFIRPSGRRCTSRPRRGSRAKARSPAGKRTRRRSPGRWPSKRWTARCAARPPRRPSRKARTASSPGCSAGRRPL